MNKPKPPALLGGALASVLAFALMVGTSSAQTKPASSGFWMRAQVIPAEYTAVGNSLSGGGDGTKYGYGLTLNGVNGTWKAGSYTIDFVVLTFSNKKESGTVSFKVVGPAGKVVYSYSWPSTQVPTTDWFTVAAKGNYATPGVYFAEVYFNSNQIGWTPLNVTS